MFILEYAKDPVFISNNTDSILITVKWAEFNEEHSFNATSYDTVPHGVELYQRALSGEFGPVAPYVPPLVATQAQPATTGSQTL